MFLKKLMATLNRFKEDLIIIINDDILYPYDMFDNVLREFKKIREKNPMCFGELFAFWSGLKIYSNLEPCNTVKYQFSMKN